MAWEPSKKQDQKQAKIIRGILAVQKQLLEQDPWVPLPQSSCCFSFGLDRKPLPVGETFNVVEIRYAGAVSEGTERKVPLKVRQRSQKLRDLAREHFRRGSADGRVHCAACDWTKPNFPLAYEIIEIHHTEEMSFSRQPDASSRWMKHSRSSALFAQAAIECCTPSPAAEASRLKNFESIWPKLRR